MCIICKKHSDQQVKPLIEGAHAYLFHYDAREEAPLVYQGHLFVEPKRHVKSPAELTDEEASECGLLLAKGARMLEACLEVEHIYTFNIGHMVEHLHFHITPRFAGTPEEYWGGPNLAKWPDAPMIGAQKIAELSKKLVLAQ